jgi:hypothetical protein
MSTIYCLKCGAPIPVGSQFCMKCGAQIPSAYAPPPPQSNSWQSAPPAAYATAAPRARSSHTGAIAAVIIVVVIIVIILVVILMSGSLSSNSSGGGGNSNPPPPTDTVVISGTVWNLNAGYYEYVGPVMLTSESSWSVSGAFTTTNGIACYIMTSSEYSSWGGSGTPSAYYWTSGTGVTTGNVDTNLPAGTYYFVWDNTNILTSTSVDITQSVVATG